LVFVILDHWKKIRPVLANDYSFLLILGLLMAIISFGLDYVIQKFQLGKLINIFSLKLTKGYVNGQLHNI